MDIHWGIVGLGKIAHKFAADLARVPNARLWAVGSTDAARAQTFADTFGARYAFGSYEAFVHCPDLHVVYNATTNDFHCPLTLDFLRKGIPVLCEKPFALDHAQALEMVEAAQKNRVFLMEALWSQFVPAFKEMLRIVASRKLGAPLSLSASFGGFFPFDASWRIFNRAQGGGSLLDIGLYPVMLAQCVFGEPKEIYARGTLNALTGVDDSCAVLLSYEKGATAVLQSSVVAKLPIEAAIYFEKGYIEIPPRFHHPHYFFVHTYDGKNPHKTEKIDRPFQGNGYQFEIQEVHNCLASNALESKIMPHAFSLNLMKTLDAIRAQMGYSY
jgi:predicted dehydrogenase